MRIRSGMILRNTVRINSSYFHYSQNLKLNFYRAQLWGLGLGVCLSVTTRALVETLLI